MPPGIGTGIGLFSEGNLYFYLPIGMNNKPRMLPVTEVTRVAGEPLVNETLSGCIGILDRV